MLCQHPSSDSALWHTSVKFQHTAQALLIEQFLLNGKKPTQPYRASRPRSIAAVDDANQTVCFLVVLASLGPDLVLTFHVPHGEIRSLFNVDTGDQDRGRKFVEFPIVPHRGLSGCVKSNCPYSHLGLANHALSYLRASFVPNLASPRCQSSASKVHEPDPDLATMLPLLPFLLPLPPLLPLPHCCYCSVTAVC